MPWGSYAVSGVLGIGVRGGWCSGRNASGRSAEDSEGAEEDSFVLHLFAGERNMTIGDAAALLISVSLREPPPPGYGSRCKRQRTKREKRLKDLGETLARMKRAELQER